ncbi:cryptochrome/photolyase family protein [Sphingomicrobium nitratireducens]|uniref:cryptochrome/photolyase family protein n=1 Tax=Sphingomicrobium nitratireducens TaxID=2964666 RepID=UPI00223FBD6A|nr:deoxyribodipyrimidine photo-lyase [Sphingomicrobium nitratireducens]
MAAPRLMWFRRDLRLSDNHALVAACDGGTIIPLYVLDEETPTHGYAMGAAQKWWLHHSLAALDEQLRGHLMLRRGNAAEIVAEVADAIGAEEIHATRLYEPWSVEQQDALGERLVLHDGECLVSSEQVCTGAGEPYKVYGPFWRALSEQLPPPAPIERPARIDYGEGPKGDRLEDWDLLPTDPNWASKFSGDWTPGEEGGRERLDDFAEEVSAYANTRNLPSEEGTSRLSPHLHMGEVSARQVWHALDLKGGAKFLKELGWRDFARQAMRAQPSIGWETGREKMQKLAYRTGSAADADFEAWTRGETGYPIVDAGMRQLWATGWMHNRVRMLAASFLTKHLLIHWERGAKWFWDCLVDADYGNNSLNWQWIAGTGTASQQFNRVMAPLSQSDKFDAAAYIREWVPELADLSDAAIHDPHEAGCAPEGYAKKLVEHKEGRERALSAYRDTK